MPPPLLPPIVVLPAFSLSQGSSSKISCSSRRDDGKAIRASRRQTQSSIVSNIKLRAKMRMITRPDHHQAPLIAFLYYHCLPSSSFNSLCAFSVQVHNSLNFAPHRSFVCSSLSPLRFASLMQASKERMAGLH